MSIIEQIKGEIDKLYGEYKDKFHQCGDQYHLGLIDGLDMAERVLDSLESEKPIIPNDRDEAAKEYAKTTFKKQYSNNPDEEVTIVEPDKYAGFIAGAKWDREQMMSKAVEGSITAAVGALGYNIAAFRFDDNHKYTILLPHKEGRKYGDKVRIIIVEE